MKRRQYIGAIATGTIASLAGCLPSAERVQEMPTPYIGDEDADVVVQVYEDMSCPSCRRFNQDVKPQINEQYISSGDIRYEHHDWPIPVHPRWSYEVANAARSVQDRLDNEAFFEYVDKMYARQQSMSVDVITEEAENVGVENPEEVANDASASLYRPVIESDKESGTEIGVNRTPTVLVNGEIMSEPSFNVISSVIDSELGE